MRRKTKARLKRLLYSNQGRKGSEISSPLDKRCQLSVRPRSMLPGGICG